MDFLPGGRPRPRLAGTSSSEITLRGRPRPRFTGAAALTFALTTFFGLDLALGFALSLTLAFTFGGRPRFFGFRATGLGGFFKRPDFFDFFAKTKCG